MPTGACGINCDVCRLNRSGICTTCGSGRSPEGERKMVSQERLLGAPCPVLACAHQQGVDYCMGDCEAFPCGLFDEGAYPFSRSFLQMQERRRKQVRKPGERIFGPVKVPPEYWAALVQKNALEVCSSALVSHLSPRGFVVPFLNWNILVDRQTHCIFQESKGDWDFVDNPLLELLLLIYLLNAGPESLSGEKVGVQDLKDAHFFQGPHEIDVKPLLGKFGKDAGGFRTAADILGGASLNMGDAAYRFLPFPKIPLYYVLWIADGEFDSSLSLMFDRSIESHLQADAILGIVELVSYWLLYGPEGIS